MNIYQLAKDKAFLVAVKAVVVNSKDEILFLKVNSSLNDSQKWDLPGGLMEYEDTVEDTLRREVLEETGIQVQDIELLTCTETIFEKFVFAENEVKDVKVAVIVYKYKLKEENPHVKLSGEHDDYIWCSDKGKLNQMILSRPSKAVIEKLITEGNI